MEKIPEVEPEDAASIAPSDLTEISELRDSEEGSFAASHDSVAPVHSYQIKPLLADKFKVGPIKEIIGNVLTDHLSGKAYHPDAVKKWTVEIANEVNAKVSELKMNRYKHIAQVILGEHKGAGVKSAVRCVWDSETDGYTSNFFSNDTLFCIATVYAVYLY